MDRVFYWLAYRLPQRLAYWAAVRVMAHASHAHGSREMDAITPADCLKAWRQTHD